jgi:hypothetical protein
LDLSWLPADKDGKKKVVYNVYAQPIDPTNQMPANPNQQPAPGQDVPLSTSRVPSHIPKGGTEGETWTYPSPQMFWNALVRKGKAEGANEVPPLEHNGSIYPFMHHESRGMHVGNKEQNGACV